MRDAVTIKIVLSVLLVMAFALGAKLMGFTADETVTFFGGALMLAAMLTAARRNGPPPR